MHHRVVTPCVGGQVFAPVLVSYWVPPSRHSQVVQCHLQRAALWEGGSCVCSQHSHTLKGVVGTSSIYHSTGEYLSNECLSIVMMKTKLAANVHSVPAPVLFCLHRFIQSLPPPYEVVASCMRKLMSHRAE